MKPARWEPWEPWEPSHSVQLVVLGLLNGGSFPGDLPMFNWDVEANVAPGKRSIAKCLDLYWVMATEKA